MVNSAVYPNLKRKPGINNWLDRLPAGLQDRWHRSYPYRIAKHLVYERGFGIGNAIAAGVNRTKDWAAGGQHVHPTVRAKAAADIALWKLIAKYGELHKTTAGKK